MLEAQLPGNWAISGFNILTCQRAEHKYIIATTKPISL